MPEYEVFVDGKNRKLELTKTGEKSFSITIDGRKRTVDIDSKALNLDKPFTVKIDGKRYHVELQTPNTGKEIPVKVDEAVFTAEIRTPVRKTTFTTFEPTMTAPSKKATANRQILEGAVVAPMTGKIVAVRVKKGEQVKAHQVLCVVEAMKMENEIQAPMSGIVISVHVKKGDSVAPDETLVEIQ